MNNNEEDETTIHRQVVEDRDDDAYLMRVPIIITTLTVGTFHLPTCLCTLDSYESVGCFCYMQSGCWGFALLVLNPQVLAPQQHHSVGVLLVSCLICFILHPHPAAIPIESAPRSSL